MRVVAGPLGYDVSVAPAGGRWIASAVRVDSGERFGPDITAGSADEAAERLARWLVWQHAHSTALILLQEVEREYHRVMSATRASALSAEETSEAERAALAHVQNARAQLDIVRARRPESH